VSNLLSASPEVYVLALLPALLWGFEPVVSKRGLSLGGTPVQASLVVVLVDTSMYWLGLVGRSLLQGGPVVAPLAPGIVAVFLVAGVVGTAVGRLAVFAGVERVGASVNSAVISARPLFATVLALVFLGEPLSLSTAAGVVVTVAGLAVLSTARGGDLRGWQPRDLLFPLAAAGAFAVGNVLRRFGLTTSPATALEAVALNETAALVAVAAYVLARDPDHLRAPRATYGYFAVSGVITAFGLLSLFAAFALPDGRVALVDPLVATAPLFTAVFAAVFLRDLERVTRGVVAGGLLVVVGVALVTLGPGVVGL
jgi:drug/metabolite transporter (DMT)-like permease